MYQSQILGFLSIIHPSIHFQYNLSHLAQHNKVVFSFFICYFKANIAIKSFSSGIAKPSSSLFNNNIYFRLNGFNILFIVLVQE